MTIHRASMIGTCLLLATAACGDEPSSSSTTGDGGGGATIVATVGTSSGGSGGSGSGGSGGPGGQSAGGAAPSGEEAFVAVGWGGRRLASCDGGATWIGDVQEAPESEDDWHRPYSPKSLAYGDGTFVFLTGWGTDSTVHVSHDGVSWMSTTLQTTYGGVGFDGARFALVGDRGFAESTDRGLTWTELSTPESRYSRAAAAFAGVLVAGADGHVETLRDGEADWQPLASCQGLRHGHLGFQGGFSAGGGILLSLGHDGDTCALAIATGDDLGAGTIGASVTFRPSYFDGAFHAATGDTLHRSTDGVSWSAAAIAGGVQIEQLVKGPGGHYVGLHRDTSTLYHSADGIAWSEAQAPPGNGFLYLAAGAVETCGS